MDPLGIWTRQKALIAELRAIRGGEFSTSSEDDLFRLALKQNLSALCLSGGGIRSAAFCLGVLQALACAGLLTSFDYLSTVSGGGYIGSWLQRMIAGRGSPEKAEAALGCADTVAAELTNLRNYTSYLAPQGGLFSTDTWTDVVLYGRNVLLNLVVYLPLLALAVLVAIFYRTAIWTVADERWAQLLFLAMGAVCVAAQTLFAARDLPDHRPVGAGTRHYAKSRQISLQVVWPSFAWAVLATLSQGVTANGSEDPPIMALLIAYFVAQTVGYIGAWCLPGRRLKAAMLFRRNGLAFGAATVVSTALLGCGAWLANLVPHDERAQVLAVAGPLWGMAAFGIHSAVFVGLRRDSALFDLDREWLARLSALKLRLGVSWLAFAFPALSLSWLIHVGGDGSVGSLQASLAALGTLATGSVGAWVGKQAESKVGVVAQAIGIAQRWRTAALVLVCIVFILGVIAFLGLAADLVLGQIQIALSSHLLQVPSDTPAPHWLLFVVQVVVIVGVVLVLHWLNRRVNVNRYSMHAVYRNRLTRAFLGAARGAARHADPFTGFDPDDNLPLTALANAEGPRKLFPVINLTLNLTSGGAAAWSERKAMAFTATPTACGAPLLCNPDDRARGQADPAGAYVATGGYAGQENPDSKSERCAGLTLATAMTISGAAVSPNWGYHSSPLVAFVMTLFNVRLGAWLPNPAFRQTAKDLSLAYPRRSLAALLGELLGMTGDKSQAIYLSDGGHFENLGLYEMLRRRCRLILVIDAGQDPRCGFEDLGNALRKSAIDMQIEVKFKNAPRITSRNDKEGQKNALGFAAATIRYPEKCEGTLLYLKPCLLSSVPVDVRAYANLYDEFPHESTVDQFFTESQFESYRALGQYQMEQVIGELPAERLCELFERAGQAYGQPAGDPASVMHGSRG
jgi:patatin-like phospholipase